MPNATTTSLCVNESDSTRVSTEPTAVMTHGLRPTSIQRGAMRGAEGLPGRETPEFPRKKVYDLKIFLLKLKN